MFKKILKIFAILLLITILSYCGVCMYIDSNKKELIESFESAFVEHCNGEILFSDIALSSWTKFPSVSFEIKDLEYNRFNIEQHKEEIIKTKNASVRLSISKLIQKKIEVKSIFIKDAFVELITNIDTTETKKVILPEVAEPKKEKKPLPLESSVNLVVENLQLTIINNQKNKKFKFVVNEIIANLDIGENDISGTLQLNTQVSDLAFNTKGGSFFNGATVVGKLKPTIDLKNKKVHIPSFDLAIDDQLFKLSSEMNLEGTGEFLFILENEETHFFKTLGLIPIRLQNKIKDYAVDKPLYTYTTIEGSFAPKSNPVVNIKFKSENNTANIKNTISLDNVNLSGRFINRIYDDERAKTEHPKNSRLIIDEVNGQYKGIDFQLKDASLLSTPEIKTAVKGVLTSSGDPKEFNNILGSDTFFFENGTFDLKAELNGDATYIDSLIRTSKVYVNLHNSSLVKREGDLHIPIKNMSLDVHNNIASLHNLQIELPSKDKIDITGEINSLTGIILPDTKDQVYSDLKIHSEKLVWDDFLTIIQATKGKKKETKKDKHNLQESLKDIYVKFNPRIEIDIEELDYKSLQIKQFKSGVHYSNINNLYLDNTSFNFGSGNVLLSGHLNIAQPKTVIIDAQVQAKGATDNLNAIFKTKDFLFKKGIFDLNAQVNGDLKHIDKLIVQANSSLLVKDASVYIKSKQLTIPVDVLDVVIKDNNALLNKLQIELASGDQIDFSGKLENIEALLSDSSQKQVSSQLKIHSKRLVWDDFTTLLTKGENESTKKSKKALKETLGSLYTSFNPRVQIDIKHFEYNDAISVQDFKTGIHFEDIENLKLEETSFVYDKNGFVNLSALVNISDPKATFIDTSIDVKGLPDQLNAIFKNDNFIFEGGSFSLKTNVKGDVNQVDNLIANASSILKIDNTNVFFNGATIPVPALEVNIIKNNALLKTLKIDFESGNQVNLFGEVTNLTSLLFHKENVPSITSELNIRSKELLFTDFTNLFATIDKSKAKKKTKNNLNTSIHRIYDQFNPTVTVAIDRFNYQDVDVENLKTNIHFESGDKIFLEDTGFDYYEGNINLNAHIDIEKTNETLFALEFNTNTLNLEKLLDSFDYFGVDVLKEADKIGGEINLEAFLEGSILEETGLQTETLSGLIEFNLENVEIRKFAPLTDITDKIFKKQRFDDIRFAPISEVIYISDNTVEIPQFEIQSTAFDFFIEGHLGLKNKGTNIWASVPLENLKHRDVVNIPDKRGYIDTGKKIFVEIASEKDQKATYKLHLTNKKLYEQKNILSQYKKKHREEAHLRRKHRRESRSKVNK